MTDRVRITIRLDPQIEQALRLEARRAGRRFQEHIRVKLAQPIESVTDRLARVERKVMFVALAQQKLFEGLELGGHLDALMAALDDPYDPFEESRMYVAEDY